MKKLPRDEALAKLQAIADGQVEVPNISAWLHREQYEVLVYSIRRDFPPDVVARALVPLMKNGHVSWSRLRKFPEELRDAFMQAARDCSAQQPEPLDPLYFAAYARGVIFEVMKTMDTAGAVWSVPNLVAKMRGGHPVDPRVVDVVVATLPELARIQPDATHDAKIHAMLLAIAARDGGAPGIAAIELYVREAMTRAPASRSAELVDVILEAFPSTAGDALRARLTTPA